MLDGDYVGARVIDATETHFTVISPESPRLYITFPYDGTTTYTSRHIQVFISIDLRRINTPDF